MTILEKYEAFWRINESWDELILKAGDKEQKILNKLYWESSMILYNPRSIKRRKIPFTKETILFINILYKSLKDKELI